MRAESVGSAGIGEDFMNAEPQALEAPQMASDIGAPLPQATPLPSSLGGSGALRKIIKDAQITIEVDSVDLAVSRLTNDASAVGGYVLETRTDFSSWGGGATIRMSVPVDRFEEALERIRATAKRVVSEAATGTDVTQEFVDITNQIANLEATQARVREFLDDAQNVEEALRVNAELSNLEGQIGQLKGRLQYLNQRSAFSTIAVEVRQSPDALTPTPSPTREPLPPFDPGETAGDAFNALRALLQVGVVAAIWLIVVGLPVALLVFGLLAVGRRWRRWRPTG